MKIGVFIAPDVLQTVGGGFSYYEKLIKAIDERSFDKRIDVCFVGRGVGKNTFKKSYFPLSAPGVHRFFYILQKLGITRFIDKVIGGNSDFANRGDLKRLQKAGVDIILYPVQFKKEVRNFPFISMNWDAGHKSSFAFPEFVSDVTYEDRYQWYEYEIKKALLIIAESDAGKKELSELFSIPENKISVVPMFPGRVVELQTSSDEQKKILEKWSIEQHQYFYYPAQFWAHKNHYNLILAFSSLIAKHPDKNLKLIFSGSDKGNKQYIQSVVDSLGLTAQVVMLGFIRDEEVFALYRNSLALVMPTFLGPTNMPLLEAQGLAVPVICSDMEGHREIAGDGALYIDPQRADSIAGAMEKVLIVDERENLLLRAKQVALHTPFTIHNALQQLEKAMIGLIPLRKTFK